MILEAFIVSVPPTLAALAALKQVGWGNGKGSLHKRMDALEIDQKINRESLKLHVIRDHQGDGK